ncbi:ribbon-helix-helix domain-containing protein [Oceanospirillum sediminis]|uniref:Ribbon-helix-helix domain-containing protein n=1 Tax=Oceanospirillum sediminis TaxID=2760088 RepID=A0A839IM80_9GAMM|nr:ribbon-helix-helix domain-containing protein [Oceanospirillum sediminis]MBB1486001.1 ribbon-helix-helix domain-containing protein [Oceanospirillum sediminis]
MCDIYASTDPALYQTLTRSVRIDSVVTSIRLEQRFWDILDEIAAGEDCSTPQFINKLYREVLERRGETGNFTSLLRVVCTVYLDNKETA